MNARLKKSFTPLVTSVMLGMVVAIALPTSAQIVPPECRLGGSGCTLCHIAVMTINITNFLMKSIAFPASVLLLVIGGLTILTAGPSEKRLTLGKTILTNTLIGLVIVMLAWLGVDTIIKILTGSFNFGGDPGSLFKNLPQQFGPWNKVDPTGCPL